MQARPETRYARSGDVTIAYQVVGDGPFDLVLVSSWITNVEENWDEPSYARLLTRLASFTRLIHFDKRGTGLSDRVPTGSSLEERMDDVRAVMDAAGSERAVLLGSTEGGPICALFAATYPERTAALIMYGAYAKRIRSPDYPWGPTTEERERLYEELREQWGGPAVLEHLAPSRLGDERFCRWWAGYLRRSASPGAAQALTQMNTEIDIRRVLRAIRVPTLVVHRTGDPLCPIEGARFLAQQIPGSSLVELPGGDHLPFVGDVDAIVDAVHEFLTGAPAVVEADRVLTTLLYADIVGSTRHASELGDRRWQELLATYLAVVRQQLTRFRGVERNTSGDAFLASFDGPARAVRCAHAIREAVAPLGLSVRAGVHSGECEVQDETLSGIALHIAARIAAQAAPDEVLASGTVKDLVVGSELAFEDRGRHTLKGVPGVWRLFAVGRDRPAPARRA